MDHHVKQNKPSSEIQVSRFLSYIELEKNHETKGGDRIIREEEEGGGGGLVRGRGEYLTYGYANVIMKPTILYN
jgi:hypothetical protein